MKTLSISLAAALTALFTLFFWFGPETLEVGRFIVLSVVVFAVYLLLLRSSRRLSLFGMHRSTLFVLVVLALTIRVIVLFSSDESTFLSNDVYRYVFEGKMIVNGVNPYTTCPEDVAAAPLVDARIFPNLRQPDQPSVYPPLSQYLFALAYLVHNDSIHGFKLISVLFELMTLLSIIVLISRYVKRHPFTSWSLLIYLFSPLVIIEFVMSSHIDILAMPFFVFSLVYLRRHQPAMTGVMLGLAAMVKLFAFFFAPVLLFYFVGRDRWRFLASLVATCLVLYLPFLIDCGTGVFASLNTCLTCWEFGGSLFPLLSMVVGGGAARIISGVLFAAVIAWAAIPGRRIVPDVGMRLFVVFGAFVILTPALFPWYLVWLLPFLVYYRNIPFLVLSGTVLLSYYGLESFSRTGLWSQPWGLPLLIYVPFYLLLIRSGWLKWKKRQSARLTA